MKSRLLITCVISIFVLPFVSIAQIRYAFDSFLTSADWRFFPPLILVAFPIILYVYVSGRTINNDLDQKYQLRRKDKKSKRQEFDLSSK